MSLGTAGQPGSGPNQFNQPNDVITAPDGSIFVSDGHSGQGMTSNEAMEKGLRGGRHRADHQVLTRRHAAQGVGTDRRASRRVPHPACDGVRSEGRLWVVDRGNHRIEIFDQEGNYLESRYLYGRISGIFIKDDMVYAIDSESSPTSH